MTLCPWCGQQTQSDTVCDWCRRPIDRKIGPPQGTRNDLDFLKDEAEPGGNSFLRWGLIGLCAVACGAALFFVLRGSGSSQEEAANPPTTTDHATSSSVGLVPTSSAASAKLVSMPQMQDHRPDYWVRQWNNGSDLISNARTNSSPMARGTADLAQAVLPNSPVKLQGVTITLVSLANGDKRAVGKADIINSSKNNVIDYRVELVWAAKDYTMMPLEGTDKELHQVYYRSLRPGKREAVQLVSLKLHDYPEGSPNTLRLTAWLDGDPGTAIDEYPIQFGH